MRLKKINACFALLTIFLFFAHFIYQAVSYILFFYHPVVTKVLGYSLVGVMLLHAILACISVFGKHDSKSIFYPGLNLQTLLQRVSMCAIACLLPLHIFSYPILQKTAGTVLLYLFEGVMILFYASMFLHIAVSFSKALITFGLLSDNKKRKIMDVVMTVICVIGFVAVSFIITMTHLKLHGG